MAHLRDVCKQDRHTIAASTRVDLRYIGLEAIEPGTGQFIDGELSKTPEVPKANSFQFGIQHVLYGKLRPYLNKVALPNFEGKCSTEIIPLLPGPDLDRAYLAYFLRTPRVVAQISGKAAGAQMPRADMNFVLGLEIPLPPLDEQLRIVDLLTRAEGVVRLRREAQRKVSEVIPALFVAMFGDPVANRGQWPMETLGAIGTLDRGRSRHRPRDAEELYGGPYPFVQTGDVANSIGRIASYKATYSEAGLAQSRLWYKGTLCITIAANIAKAAILNFDACFPDSVVGFLPNGRVRTEYVQAWLGFVQPMLEANAPQAAQKNINLETLRKLPIPLPPLDVQDEFVASVNSIRSIQTQYLASMERAEAIFQALLERALNHAGRQMRSAILLRSIADENTTAF